MGWFRQIFCVRLYTGYVRKEFWQGILRLRHFTFALAKVNGVIKSTLLKHTELKSSLEPAIFLFGSSKPCRPWFVAGCIASKIALSTKWSYHPAMSVCPFFPVCDFFMFLRQWRGSNPELLDFVHGSVFSGFIFMHRKTSTSRSCWLSGFMKSINRRRSPSFHHSSFMPKWKAKWCRISVVKKKLTLLLNLRP